LLTEIDVLSMVGERFSAHGIDFMLTGSVAMAYYAMPRMTRDLDLVVDLRLSDVKSLMDAFRVDFYLDEDAAREAIASERMFNLMHLGSAIKVDLIVRKSTEFRRLEFERRKHVQFGSIQTWIVSREDLILSKLAWARDSGSELQRRDVRQLLSGDTEADYLDRWASVLGVSGLLQELRQ
jgi:hypothetical protein